jgi:hypothetical protein
MLKQKTAAQQEVEDTIMIFVHVKEKIIPIHCGFGTQQLQWLGHVAIARYDDSNETEEDQPQPPHGWLKLGIPKKIMNAAKEELNMSAVICDVLKNKQHVYLTTSK